MSLTARGLDGSNLLGFLAALGTTRLLHAGFPDAGVKLAWVWQGQWVPSWSGVPNASEETIVQTLERELKRRAEAPEYRLDESLLLTPQAFRRFAVENGSDNEALEFLVAFASDGCVTDKDVLETTTFRSMTGAGHLVFLGSVLTLCRETTAQDIRGALFSPWEYKDPPPSMRWDPIDDRRYAYRWDNPSKAAIYSVRGANRLAIEALALFPTVPQARGLRTTCCQRKGRDFFISWPVWKPSLNVPTIKSLLTTINWSGLTPEGPDHKQRVRELAGRGIGQVFRVRRFWSGKFLNFSASTAVMGTAASIV